MAHAHRGDVKQKTPRDMQHFFAGNSQVCMHKTCYVEQFMTGAQGYGAEDARGTRIQHNGKFLLKDAKGSQKKRETDIRCGTSLTS